MLGRKGETPRLLWGGTHVCSYCTVVNYGVGGEGEMRSGGARWFIVAEVESVHGQMKHIDVSLWP